MFLPEVGQGGDRLSCRHAGASRECGPEMKDPFWSPCSVNGPVNGYCELFPFHSSNYAMEGVTKWDPLCSNASYDNLDGSTISTLEAELQEARACIEELETEKQSSKKKLEHFLKKLSEEKSAWRSREHEKVRAIIDDVKADLNRERKNRQRLEVLNSKLVNELAEAKSAVKRYMNDYEKERKTRELVEEVCDELAQEISDEKAEIESLKKECMKVREEAEDERKMLQMAEVWREERVQMKLTDAKVALDLKYSQMSYLVEQLGKFLRSKGVNLDISEVKQAEKLKHAVKSVDIEDIKEFKYEPSDPDDIFAVFEEMVENVDKGMEPCVEYGPTSSVISENSKNYQDGNFDDEQGSSFSPVSVNKSNISDTEVSEVCSVESKTRVKKVKSVTRLWKSSNNSDNYKTVFVDGIIARLSNGRLSSSNGGVVSPDCGPRKGGWSSPESVGSRVNRGRKGCIEWPRGAHKSSSKHNKLLEAGINGQKIQLKHVLKQKI